ncbi:hypothetical protein EYV94_18395 [Puteibacter caeruleilacunae]|nr:hypothetical protein EYV94_18395 [Puteibacter caeruleilacunae]
MKYILLSVVLWVMVRCSSSGILSKVSENQAKYLSHVDAEQAEPYNEINMVFEDIADQVEHWLMRNDTDVLCHDTIYVLNTLDYETGYVFGLIWSSKESFSYKIMSGSSKNVKIESGISSTFKEYSYIIEECESMEIKAKELNPSEIEGGLYFLMSRISNDIALRIETIAFEQ